MVFSGLNEKVRLTVDYERMGDAQDLVRELIEVLGSMTNIDMQQYSSCLSMRMKKVMKELEAKKGQMHVMETSSVFGFCNSIFALNKTALT